MASIQNVRLVVERIDRNRARVSVSWRICFSSCEATDGSVFNERVSLRGDDVFVDDDLATLQSQCIKAQAGCVNRSISRIVARSLLDEDPDTIIFGIVLGDKDEVYARITLTPFEPHGSSANSNTVVGHFGPAGN